MLKPITFCIQGYLLISMSDLLLYIAGNSAVVMRNSSLCTVSQIIWLSSPMSKIQNGSVPKRFILHKLLINRITLLYTVV